MWVSILVLLDVALKEDVARYTLKYGRGFNPCSLGCCSESRSRLRHLLGSGRVSILVLLDVALKARCSHCFGKRNLKFQSLFSWMLLWKAGGALALQYELWCFNPCSLGCCSERANRQNLKDRIFMFQSLFSWMLLWKWVSSNWVFRSSMFQSLFSWMLLWKVVIEFLPNAAAAGFQSLFSWMLLWKMGRHSG